MLTRQFLLQGSPRFWLWLLCAAVAGVLIVLLYQHERRLVTRSVGATLLVLRLLVVAVVFLTLLQPVLSWTIDQERSGRILVAVDLSESMSAADEHATPAEKLRWARGLGMIGNEQTRKRIDEWLAAYDAGKEPDWVSADEVADAEKRARLTKTRRENLDGVLNEVSKIPRHEIAERLLTGGTSPLVPELEKIAKVQLSIFAGKSESADAEQFGDGNSPRPGTGRGAGGEGRKAAGGPLTPDPSPQRGEGGTKPSTLDPRPSSSLQPGTTDLGAGLSVGVGGGAASEERTPVIGIVMLTDGRDTTKRDPVTVARRLGQTGTPVFPVVIGSSKHPTDLAVRSLDYPATVFKDDHPLVKVQMGTAGFEGKKLEVVLEQEGKEPLTKTIVPTGPATPVEFELNLKGLGRHQFTVRTDVQPDETRDDNNSSSFAVTVVDDKVRALLLEGTARWEFRFIDNALTRDPRVEIRQVVFDQPYLRVLPETFFPRSLPPLPTNVDDLADTPFADLDLVIVGDMAAGDTPAKLWDVLERFVSESGGTLVMCAGKNDFPLRHESPALARLLPMSNLQPVRDVGPQSTESPALRGFHLKLTPEGEAESMLQFSTDREENRDIWFGLPGHSWGLFGQPKPGATVWASVPRQELGVPGLSVLEAERRGAVIVQQPYGFGQVIWLGIDSTWRWRYRVGDKYHHRFWGQLARSAAQNKAVLGNEFVKFGPDRTDIEAGEEALFRARWVPQFLRKFPNLKARAELFRVKEKDPPEKPFTVVPLTPTEGRPMVHEGKVVSLPAGEYTVKLQVEGADIGPNDIATSLFVHSPQGLELSDLSANAELLRQIAQASGGRLLQADELAELPALIRPEVQQLSIRHEYPLWDKWPTLLLFFALLTAEWIVRKLNGLP